MLLPFLLGLKFHIATLVPLVIAAFIFLAKKAAFVGKIALFLSGLLGSAGLFSPGFINPIGHGSYGGYGYRPSNHHHHGGHHDYSDYGQYKNTDFQDKNKQQLIDNFYEYEKKLNPIDPTKLYERESRLDDVGTSAKQIGYRNFAWQTQ